MSLLWWNIVNSMTTDEINEDDMKSETLPSELPEFVSCAPSEHHFKIHIAIDFGTDGTGLNDKHLLMYSYWIQIITLYIALAYAIDGQVFAHKDWKTFKYKVLVKPKTIVLLDENLDVIGFGKDAKHTFSQILCKL